MRPLLLLALVTIAACGGSSTPPADPAAPTSTTAASDPAAPSATPTAADDAAAKKQAESDQARKAIDESQSDKPKGETPPVGNGKMNASIRIEPGTAMKVADLPQIQLKFHLSNGTSAAMDPSIDRSELLFNDKPLTTWKDTTSKIPHKGQFASLPPGESVDFVYGFGGRKVTLKSGTYKIVLKTPTVTSDPVTLVVEP